MLGQKWIACVSAAAASLALDQAAKWLVMTLLVPGARMHVLGGLVSLTQVRRSGAALGLLRALPPEQATLALLGLAGLVALLLVPLLWRAPRNDALSGTAVGLILGGAAGNLLDRLQLGGVIEFLQLDLRLFALPDFNLGDCAIAAGMALLLLDLVATEAGARPAPD